MSATLDRLTLAELAPTMRAALKDQSYRNTPIGAVVGRYIRWLRNEYGATPATVRDYEAILARMSIALADRELLDVSTEDLREVIDLWADRAAKTRAKITSVLHAFWDWCYDQNLTPFDPSRKIRRPRVPKTVPEILPLTARPQLLTAATEPRDRLGLFCLLVLGLRRAEISSIQARDFDVERGRLRVSGKGNKERVMPLRGPILAELRLWVVSDMPAVGRPPQGDDYLLYPIDRRANGKGREGQMTYAYYGRPKDKPSPQSVHRWWYRLAGAAGLVAPGRTSGLNMHRARHMFAMELRRVAGIDAASQALGHSDLSTTLGIYGHFDGSDLEAAMDKYADWLNENEGDR